MVINTFIDGTYLSAKHGKKLRATWLCDAWPCPASDFMPLLLAGSLLGRRLRTRFCLTCAPLF